jgi:Ca2+-binding RTX toxin-like protein
MGFIMLLTAKANRIGSGIQYTLNNNQDLLVKPGVTIVSTDDDAIFGSGNGQTVTVAGRVSGKDDGVQLDGNNATVLITATGYVRAVDDDAVEIRGLNSTVVNRGTIVGEYGVYYYGVGGNGAKLFNYGAIIATTDAVASSSDQTITLRNFGTITSFEGRAFYGDAGRDIVFNKGLMDGSVDLYTGNDLYDGRGGIVIGDIVGGTGNDTFRPGGGAEAISGDADIDTLDFRSGGGIRVDLNNVIANTRTAKGDIYTTIENVAGSATGADVLRGDNLVNTLKGFGGNDILVGNAGDDDIYGGAGRDTLTGGADDDQFFFFKRNELGDRITDFGNDIDTLNFQASAFGLPAGPLAAGRFKSGMSNQAGDGNDRFIFNTGTGKLFFDPDGTGAQAAVLVCDINAIVTAANIFIF